MPSRPVLYILLAGIVAGVIFSAPAYGASGGLIFICVPLFVLFLVGLSHGLRPALLASVAALIITAIGDSQNVVFFALFVMLPMGVFLRAALCWRSTDGTHEWYPVLRALCTLALLSAALFMGIALITPAAGNGQPGLQQLLSQELAENFKDADPNVVRIMQWLTGEGRFLIFALMGWTWLLMIYATAVLANTILAARHMALRASLRLQPGGLSPWLPALLVVSAACALQGHGGDALAGKTVFLMLLLPYALSGAALLHAISRSWKGRVLWLGLFYAALLSSLWPCILLIGMGVYTQASEILDRPRKMG